jgi:hypothetical protein
VSYLPLAEKGGSEASTPPLDLHDGAAPVGDGKPERAAIVEHDGGIPHPWAEGFAQLHPDQPPPNVPPQRWVQFLDDIGQFLDGPFCAAATALGWGPLDLFGCDRDRPFARLDHAGLLWMVKGNRLVALSEHAAIIEMPSGARQTFRRRPISGDHVVLPWDLAR